MTGSFSALEICCFNNIDPQKADLHRSMRIYYQESVVRNLHTLIPDISIINLSDLQTQGFTFGMRYSMNDDVIVQHQCLTSPKPSVRVEAVTVIIVSSCALGVKKHFRKYIFLAPD